MFEYKEKSATTIQCDNLSLLFAKLPLLHHGSTLYQVWEIFLQLILLFSFFLTFEYFGLVHWMANSLPVHAVTPLAAVTLLNFENKVDTCLDVM